MSHKPKYPSSLLYIVSNEFAERFSFYGMRAILVTFLIAQFFKPLGRLALQINEEALSKSIPTKFFNHTPLSPLAVFIFADNDQCQ